MFDRSLFKSNAKLCLKRYYWLGVLATLITLALAGGTIAEVGSANANFNVSLPANYSSGATAELPGDVQDILGEIGSSIQTTGEELEVYDPFPEYVPEAPEASELPDLSEFSSALEENLPDEAAVAVILGLMLVIGIVLVIAIALGVVRGLFVTNQIEVGNRRFFLTARETRPSIGTLFWSYKNSMKSTMGTLFCRDLFLTLWTLPAIVVLYVGLLAGIFTIAGSHQTVGVIVLLATVVLFFAALIPAFIKSFQYFAIAWLRAENPGMSRRRVFELSKAMTKGYKWKLFVLDLSFIGWRLLGMLCCGVGGIFLAPYVLATKAEAYTFLKTKAIENGIATADEFAGFASAQSAEQIQTVGNSEFVVEPYQA